MFGFKRDCFEYRSNGIDFNWAPTVEVNGAWLGIGAMEVVSRTEDAAEFLGANGLSWTFKRRIEGDCLFLDSRFKNRTNVPLRLGKVRMLNVAGAIAFGAPDRKTVALTDTTGQALCEARYLSDPAALRQSKIYIQFSCRAPALAAQVGFQTFTRANTFVEYDYDARAGLNGLRAVCDFAGFELAPNAELDTEQFVIRAGADPLAQMVAWATAAAESAHPQFRQSAPLGYSGSAWVDVINSAANYETIQFEMIDAINARLAGFGFEYLWVSIANLPGGMPGDWLGWNHGNFDSSPAEFRAKLRQKGWKLGLWCGPFYISSALKELVEEFKDALLRNPAGELMVVRGEWQHGDAGKLPKAQRPRLYALDPTHPQALAFMRKVFETYRTWGVSYFMLDFVEAGAGNVMRFPYQATHDRGKIPGPEAYRVFMRQIRAAAGDDTYLLACSGPTYHNVGLVDAVRTGSDFGEGRLLNPESFFYPATYVVNNMSFWTGARCALVNQAARFHSHRRLFLNDSGNVLTVDQPIPLEHARIHAAIHGLSGGPTMLGDDLRVISEERLALIKATLPRPADVAVPIDLFDTPAPVGPRVFHRRIVKPWGRHDVIAVYNLTSEPVEVPIALAQLGLEQDGEYLIWEFWNRQLIGKTSADFTARIPGESVRIFRLTKRLDYPQLLATDMHLTMGEVDIADCAYDPQAQRFYVKAIRPAGEKGGVYVYASEKVCVKNPEGLHISKDARDNRLIIYIPFDLKTGMAEREIYFEDLVKVLDMHKLELA